MSWFSNSQVSQPEDVRFAVGAWALGFFVMVNLYVLPSHPRSPRVSDVVGLLLGIGSCFHLARSGVSRSRFAISSMLLAFPALWAIIGLVKNDVNTVVQSIRWGLALPWAWVLERGWLRKVFREAFMRGLFWGAGLNVLVLVMQAAGLDELTRSLGLAALDEVAPSVHGRIRLSGVHGHPNASMGVISLVIPAALALTLGMRRSQAWLIAAVGMLFVGSSFTLTRSPLLVSAFSLAIGLLLNLRYRKTLVSALTIVVLGSLALLTGGPPGGWERWLDASNVANSLGRVATNVEAMKLLLLHPLGVGDSVRTAALGATHNAFLQVGLVFGLPFAIFLTTGLAFASLRSLRKETRTIGMLAVHVFGLFLWEDHLNNPTFIVLSSWLLVSGLLSSRRSVTAAEGGLPEGSGDCSRMPRRRMQVHRDVTVVRWS